MTCVICKNEIDKQYTPDGVMFWDKGHNPDPYPVNNEDARCCSFCNVSVVIPLRITRMFSSTTQTVDGGA